VNLEDRTLSKRVGGEDKQEDKVRDWVGLRECERRITNAEDTSSSEGRVKRL